MIRIRAIDLRDLRFVLQNAPHGDSCYSKAISKKISRTVIDLRDLRFVLFVRLTCATFGSCSLKHRNSHFLSVEYL